MKSKWALMNAIFPVLVEYDKNTFVDSGKMPPAYFLVGWLTPESVFCNIDLDIFLFDPFGLRQRRANMVNQVF